MLHTRKLGLRLTAVGLAVLSAGWQDAIPKAGTPAVPTKSLPRAATSGPRSADTGIIQTSQEVDPQAEAPASPLGELAWLVGDWVDQDEDATIGSSVNWTKNGKFLTRSFRVVPRDGEPHSGMQIIGWDPAEKAIRSWTYDADGGFGEERWRRTGDRWTIRTKYTLPGGERGVATNVMRRIDDNTYTWKSGNRIIGGALQPDIDEVTVVRRTPGDETESASGAREPSVAPSPAVEAPSLEPAPEPAPGSTESEEKP